MQQTTRRGFFAALAGAAVATQAPPLPASPAIAPLDPASAAYALKCVNSMIDEWNVASKSYEAWCYVGGGHLFYVLEATPAGMKDDPWRPMVSVVPLEQQHQVHRRRLPA